MRIGCQIAALAALAFGCTSANAVEVINFEQYPVGYVGSATTEGGNPFSIRAGPIEFDSTPGIGKYSSLPVAQRSSGTWSAFGISAVRIDEVTALFPRILYLDVRSELGGTFVHLFSPGHNPIETQLTPNIWTRIHIDGILNGNTTLFVRNGGALSIDNFTFENNFVHVPEPSTWAMLILGFGAIGTALRRQRTPHPARS